MGAKFSVMIVDGTTNSGITGLEVQLWHHPVTVSSEGVVTGTRAKTYQGADVAATAKGYGVYEFSDIPTGFYAVVYGSLNIKTAVLTGYDGFPVVDASQHGMVVKDRNLDKYYRIVVANGVLSIEEVS